MTIQKLIERLKWIGGFVVEDNNNLSRYWERAGEKAGFRLHYVEGRPHDPDVLWVYTDAPNDGERQIATIILSSLKDIVLRAEDDNCAEWFEDDTAVLDITLTDGTNFGILLPLPTGIEEEEMQYAGDIYGYDDVD